ncbi:MAG TPA: penicillin-binding protein activator [Stellaceae bacterium]|nr:penicillin-binding protein activator [Stellaceae bacterium]
MTAKSLARIGLMALAAAFASIAARGAAADELRIGFLAPTTGPFAQIAADMRNGFQMYLDDHKGQFHGATVKFIVEDTQGKPATAVLKAEKLIKQNKVNMLVGGLLASTGYALAPVSTREKVIYISSIPASDNLTQRDASKYPYFARTSWSSSQPSHPFGAWACAHGFKKIDTIASDYAFGYEVVGGFQKTFEQCGGKIVQKIWPPINTMDFGPYIADLNPDADAIFIVPVGAGTLQLPKQLAASGNKKRVIGAGTSFDEFVLPSMGDEVIGDISALHYSAALQTPENEAFVKEYRAKYGKVPSYYSENNYTTAALIDAVMTETGGKWPGAQEFLKRLVALKINAPRGPVSFDDMRNPIQNIYIRKVEKTKMFGYPKPELWNVVIKTYPHVSQFWTYGKAEFLKQPVYSRDYPPCKYCE